MTEDNSNSNDHPAERDEDMSPYRKPAASVISFKLIYSKDDLQSRKVIHFRPEMSHQVFGEDETIFGYRTLSITINYLHNSSRCFVDVLKEGILKSTPMPQLDDIMKCLEPWLPEKFTTEKEEFLKMIENERHDNMYGALLSEFKDKQECKVFPNQKVFADYKICICDMKNEEFKEFHKRFETYIVWFIDAANFIDLDDERWMLYYVYEEFQHPETKATYRTPVGYCSVYKFFAYPNNIRTRISQFFILPSHQRRGIGSKFYQTVVRNIREMPEVVDITVEEPTSTFQKIRDYDDCLTVHRELDTHNINICTDDVKTIFEHMRKYKLCKRQCQRVYDILGSYKAAKTSQIAYLKYNRGVMKRITAEVEKETRGTKRLCNLERMGVTVECPDKDTIIEVVYKKYIEDIEPSLKYLQQHFVES